MNITYDINSPVSNPLWKRDKPVEPCSYPMPNQGETLTRIISAECQTAVLLTTAIATTISKLLDKRSPRVGAIIFGLLIGFVVFLIPDPNAPITDAPWPHIWIHVYCNHALLWVHADQAEEGCHPGPESRAFMADLQMLATYPVSG